MSSIDRPLFNREFSFIGMVSSMFEKYAMDRTVVQEHLCGYFIQGVFVFGKVKNDFTGNRN